MRRNHHHYNAGKHQKYTQTVVLPARQLYREKQEKVLLLLLLPSYTKVNNTNKCWEKIVTYQKKEEEKGMNAITGEDHCWRGDRVDSVDDLSLQELYPASAVVSDRASHNNNNKNSAL